MPTVVKLPKSAFRANHCAEANHVFLWTHCPEPPFMRPHAGWKIVGYGEAPWPKKDWPIAVMFERVDPPSNALGDSMGNEMTEGTQIWQHGREEWVPGTTAYNRRLRIEQS